MEQLTRDEFPEIHLISKYNGMHDRNQGEGTVDYSLNISPGFLEMISLVFKAESVTNSYQLILPQ